MELSSEAHDRVRAANNIWPTNQHEAQMRRDELTRANNALQNLSPKLQLLYDSILQNPEGYKWMHRKSAQRMRKKLKAFRLRLEDGRMNEEDVRTAYESWKGHMKRGNSYRVLRRMDRFYKKTILQGGQQCMR